MIPVVLLVLSVPGVDLRPVVPVRPVTSYTFADLRQLEGTVIEVRVEAVSMPWPDGKVWITEVEAPKGLSWTVWGRTELEDAGVVRGRVEVVRHPPAVHGGQLFEGFTEVRLHVP